MPPPGQGLLWAMTPSGGGKKDAVSAAPEVTPADSAAQPSGEDSAHKELLRGATFLLAVTDRASDATAADQLVKKVHAANIWTADQFVERINRVPGLKELSGTPFMVQP